MAQFVFDSPGPFFFEVADEGLVIQAIYLGLHAGHVGGELGELGEDFFGDEFEAFGQYGWAGEGCLRGEDEAPFTKAGDEGVIRLGLQTAGTQGGIHAPEGLAGDVRGGGLYDHGSIGFQHLQQALIKGGGVELSQGEIGGVGEVEDDEVKGLMRLIQPGKGIGIFHLQARRFQRVRILLTQHGIRPYWHQRIPPNDGGIALGQIYALERMAKKTHDKLQEAEVIG